MVTKSTVCIKVNQDRSFFVFFYSKMDSSSDYPEWVGDDFRREWMNDSESYDMWFVVGNERIGADKFLIKRNGPVLRQRVKEMIERNQQEVVIADGEVSAATLRLVEFCYMRKLRLNRLTADELTALDAAARFYQLDRLLYGLNNYKKKGKWMRRKIKFNFCFQLLWTVSWSVINIFTNRNCHAH